MSLKKNTVVPNKAAGNLIPKPKAETPEVILVKSSPNQKHGKKDLARIIAEKVHLAGKAVPIRVAEIMVSAYEEAIIESLSQKIEVVLPGFGKFYTIEKEAAERHNPSTGGKVMVEAHTAVKFKMGAKLKHAASDVPDETT